ncbi:MAG: hypothetical protein SFY80_02740 [Verrucomicrobiota bacterium]|nr:hypothetical protein [Verrucomicrobiota bacterium]
MPEAAKCYQCESDNPVGVPSAINRDKNVSATLDASNRQYHHRVEHPITLLRVSGEDAASFLQSQFSNNLRNMAHDRAVYGLWLDRKGKVCADSFILQEGSGSFLLFSYECSAATIKEKLERFIVADDVVVESIGASYLDLVVWGGHSSTRLGAAEGTYPAAASWYRSGEALLVHGRRSTEKHADILIPLKDTALLEAYLLDLEKSGSMEVSWSEMEHERLRSRIPSVPRDVTPGELPQEGGLVDDAVCFTKGCYLGQEVMAHLKRSGGFRRRLHPVSMAGFPPSANALIYAGDKQAGELRSYLYNGSSGLGFALMKHRELAGRRQFSLFPDGPEAITIC